MKQRSRDMHIRPIEMKFLPGMKVRWTPIDYEKPKPKFLFGEVREVVESGVMVKFCNYRHALLCSPERLEIVAEIK